MRAAIVGTGFWAGYAYVPALRAIADMELVACVSRSEEGARRFAGEHGIPATYPSLDGLIASSVRPDLIVIAGPDDMHPPAAMAVIDAGIAVFCEKPLANRADTARSMADRASREAVPNTVGYSFRYSPAIGALRADIEDGTLGEPWLMEISEYNAQFHPQLGKPMNWKGDPDKAKAGALFEYGSHAVDLADWLIGPITAVSTALARVLPDARLDDIATLQFRGRPPSIGVLIAAWVLSGSIPGIRVRLHGSRGLAEAELSQALPGGEAYRRYSLDGTIREEVPIEALGDSGSAYARRHLADFVATIDDEGGATSATLPTFADGARIQRILQTALEATDGWMEVEASAPGPQKRRLR